MSNRVRSFLEHLPAECRAHFAELADLDTRLDAILATAAASVPELQLTDDTFLSYLAERFGPDETSASPFDKLRPADLYLACGCAYGDQSAIALFRRTYLPKIKAALVNIGLPEIVEDIGQEVFAHLLVAQPGQRPAICKYLGRGELAAWVQVSAVRLARRRIRKQRREQLTDEDYLFDRALPAGDRELQSLKVKYRDQFKEAFQKAFADLDARERNIMRYELCGGLNIDQIGVLYDVHRSTVARWRTACREKILRLTRKAFQQTHRVSSGEFVSIVRLIESQLEVSLPRLLEEQSAE